MLKKRDLKYKQQTITIKITINTKITISIFIRKLMTKQQNNNNFFYVYYIFFDAELIPIVLYEIYTTKNTRYIYKYTAIGPFYSCIYHVCSSVLLGRTYDHVF